MNSVVTHTLVPYHALQVLCHFLSFTFSVFVIVVECTCMQHCFKYG
jgi:hypothetical protein